MVMLAMAMGLDSITGEAIMVLGGAIGFSTGTFNMFTTVVAQNIAELPTYSGLWYRAVCFVVFYIVTNIYLIRYAKKIKKNPEKSPMYDLDQLTKDNAATLDLDKTGELSGKMMIPLVLLVIAFAAIIYGATSSSGVCPTWRLFPYLYSCGRSDYWNESKRCLQGYFERKQANARSNLYYWDGNSYQWYYE